MSVNKKPSDTYPVDRILLSRYCKKDNEPVAIWLLIRYKKRLLLRAFNILKDKHLVKDVLQNVAEELVRHEEKKREGKLKIYEERVVKSLLGIIYYRSIDMLRHRGITQINTLPLEDYANSCVLPEEIKNELKLEAIFKELYQLFIKKGWEKDWHFLEIWLECDPKDNERITEILNLNQDQIRTIKQRIKRRIMKFYIRRKKQKKV